MTASPQDGPAQASAEHSTAELASMRLGRFDSTSDAHEAVAWGQARVDAAHARVDAARDGGWDAYADASRAEGDARLDLRNIHAHAAEQYGHEWQLPPSSTATGGRSR